MKTFPLAIVQTIVAQFSSILLYKLIELETVGAYQKFYYSGSLVYTLLLLGSEQAIVTRKVKKQKNIIDDQTSSYFLLFAIGLLGYLLFTILTLGYEFEELFIISTIIISLYLIKVHQTFVTVENNYNKFYLRSIIISLFLILLYYLFYLLGLTNQIILLGCSRILIVAFYLIFISRDVLHTFRFKFQPSILKVLKKDFYFILFFIISSVYLFIDRVLLIESLDNISYANYVFNFSLASFFFLPKIVISNQYINKCREEGFKLMIFKKSIPFYILVMVGFLIAYYPVINFLKLESNFWILILISVIALLDLILGPNGMVLQIKYNERKLISGEIMALTIFLIAFNFLYSNWKLVLVLYFLSRTLLNLYRQYQIKFYE